MRTAILIPIILLCIASQPSQASNKNADLVTRRNGYTIYLTNKDKAGVPLDKPTAQFSCDDRIYGVIEIHRPGESGTHVLFATWRNPEGADQEHTRYGFLVTRGTARLWVWLKLRRSTAGVIIRFANPSAGLEQFVGQWEILLQIDGKMIAKKKFNVLC